LILDKVIYPAAAVAFLASPLIYGGAVAWQNVATTLAAAAAGGGFFLCQYLFSKGKWIGGGDVKMGFLMGLILGVRGLLVALFFSYVLGALFGLGLIAAHRKTMKSQIPFGTFLAVGTIIALFWVEPILRWYFNH
jgi:prepilin signal peptidase PulO-like enzyme (type II secretory pathway)